MLSGPFTTLLILSAPADAPPFDARAHRSALERELERSGARGLVAIEVLPEATESALRKRLARGPVHAVHFIGHGRSRQMAQYGTVVLQDSTGRSRGVDGSYLASLLTAQPALRAVLLQACDDGEDPLGQVADSLAASGIAVTVSTSRLEPDVAGSFAAGLYASLFGGEPPQTAFERARGAVAARGYGPGSGRFRLQAQAPTSPLDIVAPAPAPAPATAPPAPVTPPSGDAPPVLPARRPARDPSEEACAREIERKRAAGAFDVFLCHNTADKPAVKRIARRLVARGVLPWLDEWELPPGQPWQPLLERQIGSIKSAAVFVGSAGVGPWQAQELYGFLRELTERRCPVIPVLLEDAPAAPELPIFLKAMMWVDFRKNDPDPFERLLWGITGVRPPID